MSTIITLIKRIFSNIFQQNSFKIQTFTYFIPAPKPRMSGYREKQFDKVFYQFINKGYKILDFKTQQCTKGPETSGIWLIFVVQAKNSSAEALNLDDFSIDTYENDEVISHKVTTEPPQFEEDPQLEESKINIQLDENQEPYVELPETNEDFPEKVQGLYQIKEEKKFE